MNWEAQYQARQMRWDKGEPAPRLVDFLANRPGLQHGRVCVPGCGLGHDVRAWAKAGWSATGVDIAPTGIAMAREQTPQDVAHASFAVGDFLNDSPTLPFDWLFEHTLFCAIQPCFRDAYTQAVLRWLTPGGFFLAIHYMITPGDGPPFHVTREEVLNRFEPCFDLLEEWEPRSHPNRTGRERMFWWRRKPQGTL